MATMDIKQSAKTARDGLQQGIYAIINPFVRLLIRMGVTPNMVTTIGMLGNIAAAAVMVWAAIKVSQYNQAPDFGLVTWAGVLIIAFSLFDMLDGQVARLGNMSSIYGAMYDSVLDRYCELFTLGGIAAFLIACGNIWGAIITFLALVGSIMVSYVRARAEGLDIECKIGFMQRPERVVVTAAATIATGITGMNIDPASYFDPNIILTFAMGVIAVFANLTAFARLTHSRRELIKSGRK